MSSTTKDTLLSAIESNPGGTREQLLALAGLPGSKADPARLRLWLSGLIEPESEAGWTAALDRNFESVGWQAVADPGRRAEVAARAATRRLRNAEKSAEQKAREIVEGLED